MVNSVDYATGTITYRPQIQYKFSCLYPMQYLLNNTELGVWVLQSITVQPLCTDLSKRCWTLVLISPQRRTGVNLAIRDNNGTFLSTLSMHLFQVRPDKEPESFHPPELFPNTEQIKFWGVLPKAKKKKNCVILNKTTISYIYMFFFFLFPVQQDEQYQQALIMPPTGLNLKTKIYVAVKASNLTDRYSNALVLYIFIWEYIGVVPETEGIQN